MRYLFLVNDMGRIKTLYELTREPLDYSANLVANIVTVAVVFLWLQENYRSLSTELKIIGIAALTMLIIVLLKNFKKLLEYFNYSIDSIGLQTSLRQASRELSVNKPIDYEKVIPKSSTLRYLTQKATEIARRHLAKDSILIALTISFQNVFPKGKLGVNASFVSFSPLKRMTGESKFHNLKTPRKLNKFNWSLHYKESQYSEITPFFEDSFWRQALIVAFQRVESNLIGKEFSCQVSKSTMMNDYAMWIQFMPEEPVSRSYVFTYANNKLKEGLSNNAEVIADFSINSNQ